jgi:hypothetical protein
MSMTDRNTRSRYLLIGPRGRGGRKLVLGAQDRLRRRRSGVSGWRPGRPLALFEVGPAAGCGQGEGFDG